MVVAGGDDYGTVTGRTETQPYSVTFTPPSGYSEKWLSGSAALVVCGGVCSSHTVSFDLDMTKVVKTAHCPRHQVKTLLRRGKIARLPFSVGTTAARRPCTPSCTKAGPRFGA